MNDLEALLETLKNTSDAELRKAYNGTLGGRTVHDRVLETYVDADTPNDRAQWAACVHRFIDLGLPHDGAIPIVYVLLLRDQDPTPSLTTGLLERYLEAGYILVDERSPFPLARLGDAGSEAPRVLPLATAIQLDKPDAVRLLLHKGASTELGYVDAEHPHEQAGEFAAELQRSACLAVIREFEMKRAIDKADRIELAATGRGADAGVGHVAPRRRVGA